MEVIFPESIDISLLIVKLGEQFASYSLRNCRMKLKILQRKKSYGCVHKNDDLMFSSTHLMKKLHLV